MMSHSNTTPVTVQLGSDPGNLCSHPFKYNACYCSTSVFWTVNCGFWNSNTTPVIIQTQSSVMRLLLPYSNTTFVTIQFTFVSNASAKTRFKHNTCYSSTIWLARHCIRDSNSNTTPVTVQPEFACYCSPHNIIQIQYLLLFNIYFIHHRRIPPHIQIQYLLLFNNRQAFKRKEVW